MLKKSVGCIALEAVVIVERDGKRIGCGRTNSLKSGDKNRIGLHGSQRNSAALTAIH